MVYNEDAYREVFPEVKNEKVVIKPAQSMIEDEPAQEPVRDEAEQELEVDAPDPVQEGGVDESGTDDTAD